MSRLITPERGTQNLEPNTLSKTRNTTDHKQQTTNIIDIPTGKGMNRKRSASGNTTTIQQPYRGLSRMKLFLALSRTPHGLIDMSTPALGALLWLGAYPPLKVVVLGLITAFAGYTAVYALNDVIDYRVDKEKFQKGVLHKDETDLDALMVPHPVAKGFLSMKEGLMWVIGWSLLALIGAYLLNPFCTVIFLTACVLEAVYCLMLRVNHLRTVISGAVKTSGAVAAVFAVDADPSIFFLGGLFIWLAIWEIGGQNIPNDWSDIKEDKRIKARTIPVRYGPEKSTVIILISLILAVIISAILFLFAPADFGIPVAIAVVLAGFYLLLFPAYRLYKGKERHQALILFNRASYYPLTLLLMVGIKIVI